ncbi:ferredoxin:protochlorophyllide reductase (ATP-dependent) subunit B [Salinisphaera sp. Q1T1-3]|uniref:ferredoxin:protochlorophyllide reductase (ATP-dependent) subunit B n=1 Tax=Salinisphaera sp. Q1T1-3 TaxID=2321229 RepID=UPI000E75265B|nr:ferredoxin:protochlorophyllide reductase (ATP-dependent) subunit B [Salinisphaera sp. Q1T1-3]RJS92079.1 ferredoxin:protochlorophyllide reductase (ATP-dependent) subunit B [Salinisphaera sp. Q1T1-3]
MQLSLWTYEGPPHVGAMRIATSMRDVHLVLHAPQGDTYADLLFTMIERRDHRPPVTYTTFKERDLGGDTANLVTRALADAAERFKPQVLLAGESCTAELIQDQPGALASGMDLPCPVVPLELPAYSKKENWGAAETFYKMVRGLLTPHAPAPGTQASPMPDTRRPRANVLGPSALGFRCRDDITEIARLLSLIGVDVNLVAPEGASPAELLRIPEADFNICLYPEVAKTTCRWLERTFKQPTVHTVPIGIGAIRDFAREIGELTGLDVSHVVDQTHSRLPWYSRSVDSTYLTGKRVFVFGDATHAIAAARIAVDELGFELVGLGTYSRELARDVRAAAKQYDLDALITDDYLDVERMIEELAPELVLGTQMERHIAKRRGIGCAVISAPFHVQDCPARYSPQVGFEGANVIFDTWVHPLVMGLEEHLLGMFRDDFEFHDDATASHLAAEGETRTDAATTQHAANDAPPWHADAEAELKKIPFFVRGKARRNTEAYARDLALSEITLDTLYEAKAHFSR